MNIKFRKGGRKNSRQMDPLSRGHIAKPRNRELCKFITKGGEQPSGTRPGSPKGGGQFEVRRRFHCRKKNQEKRNTECAKRNHEKVSADKAGRGKVSKRGHRHLGGEPLEEVSDVTATSTSRDVPFRGTGRGHKKGRLSSWQRRGAHQ